MATIIVKQDGSGDYTTIDAAVNAAATGDTANRLKMIPVTATSAAPLRTPGRRIVPSPLG